MSMMVLGYDGNCSACGGLASAIRREVGDQLELLPLQDPRMLSWRQEIFGSDPPWAPTLIEVQEDGQAASGHVGLPLAINLVRVVGPRKAHAVVRTIGEDRLRGGQGLLGRRRFVQFVAGLSVGAGTIMGFPAIASAGPRVGKLFSPFDDPAFFSSPVVTRRP